MPTPSDTTPPTASDLVDDTIAHTTCPPEIIRASAFTIASEERSADRDDDVGEEGTVSAVVESTLGGRADDATSFLGETASDLSLKGREIDEDTIMDSPSPTSSSSDSKEDQSSTPASQTSSISSTTSTSSSLSYEFSNVRVC